ncbi:MAG: permease [Pseudomonadota bacterium]
MADTATTTPPVPRRIDKTWLATGLILALVAAFDHSQFWPAVGFATNAVLHTAPFILFAVFAVAYLKATDAETLIAKVFEGNPARMIILAALLGGMSPFCSCEVIPFIAALLAVGAPIGAVMAFWLASPLMDPAMFLITSGTLGWEFAIAKALAAVGLGLLGGFGTHLLAKSPVFIDPLREQTAIGGGCGAKKPFSGQPVWRFWTKPERTLVFRNTAISNALFLLKWLTLAYTIEALMLRYVPAEWIAGALGGEGIGPIIMGAVIGAPAYLNGYAAVPLIDAMLDQGMTQGAAMSFVIAGGVSSIPAAVAVWALVKPRVFAAYFAFGLCGALIAGLLWQAVA